MKREVTISPAAVSNGVLGLLHALEPEDVAKLARSSQMLGVLADALAGLFPLQRPGAAPGNADPAPAAEPAAGKPKPLAPWPVTLELLTAAARGPRPVYVHTLAKANNWAPDVIRALVRKHPDVFHPLAGKGWQQVSLRAPGSPPDSAPPAATGSAPPTSTAA